MSDKTVRFAGAARQSGFTSIENSVLFDSALSPNARLAYVMLSSYAWQTDECWPGQQGIAAAMGVTAKTLRGYIAELVSAGLLDVQRRGAMQTNIYTLHTADEAAGRVKTTDHDGDPASGHDGDPTTHEEDTEEEDEEDGSPNRPVDTGLELRPSGNTGTPARARGTDGETYAPRLCERLADKIEANGCRRPTITKAWLNEARLLVDRDGVNGEEVMAAIDWATSHHFWKANILSMPTLRRQFDRLRLQAQAERAAPSPTRAYDAAMESLREMAESS